MPLGVPIADPALAATEETWPHKMARIAIGSPPRIARVSSVEPRARAERAGTGVENSTHQMRPTP